MRFELATFGLRDVCVIQANKSPFFHFCLQQPSFLCNHTKCNVLNGVSQIYIQSNTKCSETSLQQHYMLIHSINYDYTMYS